MSYRLKAGRERLKDAPLDHIKRWNLNAELDEDRDHTLTIDHSATVAVTRQLAAIDQWLASAESIPDDALMQHFKDESTSIAGDTSNVPISNRTAKPAYAFNQIPDSILEETLETLPKRVSAMRAILNRAIHQAPLRLSPRLSVFHENSLRLADNATPKQVMFQLYRVRMELCDHLFKSKLNHTRRRENKAHKARVDAINRWFEHHPRLTVIHVIFCPDASSQQARLVPQPPSSSSDSDTPSEPEPTWPECFEALRTDRDRFLKALRAGSSELKGVVGYVWRLYYASEGGFRLAMVLLFDPEICNQPLPDIMAGIRTVWRTTSKTEGLVLSANTSRVQQPNTPQRSIPSSPEQRTPPKELSPEIVTQLYSCQLGTVACDNRGHMRDLQSLINWLSALEHYTQLYLPTADSTEPSATEPVTMKKVSRAPRNQGHGDGPAFRRLKPTDTDAQG